MNGIGEYYVINHIVMFTGLSERTIRSHIAAGFLKGEKINGLWHFTPEEVENFINHPSVKPGILAKSNSLVYDFLSDTGKKADEMVVILDMPGKSKIEISNFFAGKFVMAIIKISNFLSAICRASIELLYPAAYQGY